LNIQDLAGLSLTCRGTASCCPMDPYRLV